MSLKYKYIRVRVDNTNIYVCLYIRVFLYHVSSRRGGTSKFFCRASSFSTIGKSDIKKKKTRKILAQIISLRSSLFIGVRINRSN